MEIKKRNLKICPRCNEEYADYPALSRRDNTTDICTDCGVEEAMIDLSCGTNKPISGAMVDREIKFVTSLIRKEI